MGPLVLGMDVGGTSSRAVLTDRDGAILGRGRAGGGNPVTVGPERAAARIAEAARAALEGVHPARVRAGVMGIAGASVVDDTGAFQRAWDAIGLRCEVRLVGDVVVAFAAGAEESTGTVLIAGTGAAAARIEDGRETRVRDGLGWLLGDRGSGFWIGREAASLTAEALQAGAPPTPLARAVAEAVTGRPSPTAEDFAGAVYRDPVMGLAELAPLVDRYAARGDRTAAAVLGRAAEHLARTVLSLHAGREDGPIVLAGSVLRQCRSVREGVGARIAAALPRTEVRLAGAGELGAARLAIRGM